MTNIDIIILSYAKNEHLKKLTQQTIDTCMASEDPNQINFKILVMESEKSIEPFQFEGSKTIYPKEKFGFNRYLNIGIKETGSNFICLCNNDLIFYKGWASEILKALGFDISISSASPYCSIFHTSKNINFNDGISYGYINGIHVAGWCIFVKREIFLKIGLFDERFKFWCCDDDYRMTLKSKNIKHALIKMSKVDHLGSMSLSEIQTKNVPFKTKRLTTAQQHYFDYKWNHKNLILLWLKYLKLYLIDK